MNVWTEQMRGGRLLVTSGLRQIFDQFFSGNGENLGLAQVEYADSTSIPRD